MSGMQLLSDFLLGQLHRESRRDPHQNVSIMHANTCWRRSTPEHKLGSTWVPMVLEPRRTMNDRDEEPFNFDKAGESSVEGVIFRELLAFSRLDAPLPRLTEGDPRHIAGHVVRRGLRQNWLFQETWRRHGRLTRLEAVGELEDRR